MPNKPFSATTGLNRSQSQPRSQRPFFRKNGLVGPLPLLPIIPTANTLKGNPRSFLTKSRSDRRAAAPLWGKRVRTPRPSKPPARSAPAPTASPQTRPRLRGRPVPQARRGHRAANLRSPLASGPPARFRPPARKLDRQLRSTAPSPTNRATWFHSHPPPTPTQPLTQRHINFIEVFVAADFRRRRRSRRGTHQPGTKPVHGWRRRARTVSREGQSRRPATSHSRTQNSCTEERARAPAAS